MTPRETYGASEIAEELADLGVTRTNVTQWHFRQVRGLAGSRGIPPADEELGMGPIWRASTIEPWLPRVRRELAGRKGATK